MNNTANRFGGVRPQSTKPAIHTHKHIRKFYFFFFLSCSLPAHYISPVSWNEPHQAMHTQFSCGTTRHNHYSPCLLQHLNTTQHSDTCVYASYASAHIACCPVHTVLFLRFFFLSHPPRQRACCIFLSYLLIAQICFSVFLYFRCGFCRYALAANTVFGGGPA